MEPELSPRTRSLKKPFDLPAMFRRIEKTIASFPKAMLFELVERGFSDPFSQLAACVISIRTYDEVSGPCALRLLEKAPTSRRMAKMSEEEIDSLIAPATFHRQKAGTLRTIAVEIEERFDGVPPCDPEALMSLKGVGPKCANLVLGIACGKPFIGVDVHVHRVTNRWVYVAAKTPEKTMAELERKLPKKFWIDINRLLVPFGKNICTGTRPKCSTCPVIEMCRQVGVVNPR